MASTQVVETSVAKDSPSQDSSHPVDHFQSRYVTPDLKPFSYLLVLFSLSFPYFYSPQAGCYFYFKTIHSNPDINYVSLVAGIIVTYFRECKLIFGRTVSTRVTIVVNLNFPVALAPQKRVAAGRPNGNFNLREMHYHGSIILILTVAVTFR